MFFTNDFNQHPLFCHIKPYDLIDEYDTPLYVYSEDVLRNRCRELKKLLQYPKFSVNYSPKANSNIELLKIIRSEGLDVDAMSPGEIFLNKIAGFSNDQILYIGNNVSQKEMKSVADQGIKVSVDSVTQLDSYGKINPGGNVVLRFNPGFGAGHHTKVITAGKNTKFGIDPLLIPEVKDILKKYRLKAIGINQHIGSQFLDIEPYIKATESILSIALQFEDLDFVDFGGGFGIPYKEKNKRLDLKKLGSQLDDIITKWIRIYSKEIHFKIEPGRYVVGESSVLIGSVHAVKTNHNKRYIGTDLGFNVLMRPVMYDSWQEIEIYRKKAEKSDRMENATIVGNICESGDIIANDRYLPEILEGDLIGVLDSGAYGYSMSSSYNLRLRPAEVLIDCNGNTRLIRRRETLDDMLALFPNHS